MTPPLYWTVWYNLETAYYVLLGVDVSSIFERIERVNFFWSSALKLAVNTSNDVQNHPQWVKNYEKL